MNVYSMKKQKPHSGRKRAAARSPYANPCFIDVSLAQIMPFRKAASDGQGRKYQR
jgi:hypothetical protein